MIKKMAVLATAALLSAGAAFGQAKNTILFIGDGTGVGSLNAASIYGYGEVQALYLQKMPHLALADTSTADWWVGDGAAGGSAMATGHKTPNGVVSMAAGAERGKKDGEIYKTVMEHAMERGLSTGIVTNHGGTGVAGGTVAAFYAHHNERRKSWEILRQALNPQFGKGPDILIGVGLSKIQTEASEAGKDLAKEIRSKGYAYFTSLDAVSQLPPDKGRVIALFDDEEFDLEKAVDQAILRLSKNPKGYFLVVHSDCHLHDARSSLDRIIIFDRVIGKVTEQVKHDTLILYTSDHGYDLRLTGDKRPETKKSADHRQIAAAVSLEVDDNTAEEVPLIAAGPGSERVRGYMSNTDVFHIIMKSFGWQ